MSTQNDGVVLIQRDIDNANRIITETEDPGTKSPGSYLNPIIENLLKRQEQKKMVEDIKNEMTVDVPKHEELKKVGDLRSISLEQIDGSDVAVFQTVEFGPNSKITELMKSEVMEIHSIFDRDEAVIGSNGEILPFNSREKDDKQIPKNDFICTECNTKFSTKKTLTHHVKYKHSETKLVYPCPLCKDNLSNAWSVYRHLLKVHRMTSNQIRRYRNQIHNSAIFKKPEESKLRRRNTKESRHGHDEENEWLDNIEGDSDLQMCGGCGKHFERKAALISHSVMCIKRIAVCNSIKESHSKKKELDVKENEEKFRTSSCKVTGSAKRKSSKLITYKPKTENLLNQIQNEGIIIESRIKEKEHQIQNEGIMIESRIKEEEHQIQNEGIMIESGIKENELSTVNLKLISEENDSDTENCTDWMKKDIQMYDKDRVMSIIGVDTGASIDKAGTLSSESISSIVSDRSDSPCRGFETVESSEYVVHVEMEGLCNLTKLCKEDIPNVSFIPLAAKEDSNNFEDVVSEDSKDVNISLDPEAFSNNSEDKLAAEEVSNNSENEATKDSKGIEIIQLDAVSNNSEEKVTGGDIPIFQSDNGEAESNTSDNSEYKVTEVGVSISPSKSSPEREAEVSSEISLDNKINSDFKLDLCDDPNFQDVSIKSLIKEIIEEDDINSETKDSPDLKGTEKSICNALDQEKTTNEDQGTVEHCTSEERLNNNYDVETVENLVSEDEHKSSTQMKKRKRINSPSQRNVKKNSIPNSSGETSDFTENEIFISKISRFADMPNLRCDLCKSQFHSLSQLLPHMSNHLSWYRFQCSRCSFMSFNKCDCEKHVQEEHKLPATHIQGTVLPIPTWKSSIISDNFITPSIDTENEVSFGLDSGLVDEVDMSIDMKVESVKLETTEEYCSKNEKKVVGYIDLTMEENPDDTNTVEVTENCLLKTETDGIQDLSKQAIMEVILGNENQKEKHGKKCISSESCEYARPMRNRTKSVKASQKDFIYDFDGPKGTSIKGHGSKVDTEHIPEFEVQD